MLLNYTTGHLGPYKCSWCWTILNEYVQLEWETASDLSLGVLFPETYSCLLRLKSSSEEDAVRMQAGSGENHVLYVFNFNSLFLSYALLVTTMLLEVIVTFLSIPKQNSFPDSIGDDLIIEVQDSKGQLHGRGLAQLATITDEPVRFLKPIIIYKG